MSDETLIQLARALQDVMAMGQKASGSPVSPSNLYGKTGLFGRCDGPATLVNAMVGPYGVESILDWVGNNTENEFVDTIKGISEQGSEQSTVCGDCVKVYTKACAQLYCFGRFCRSTQELQFDKIGLKANANVPMKALFGSLTDSMGNVLIAQGEQITDQFFLQTRAMGYALRLKNSTMIWNGEVCNGDPPAYEEYKGFETIVNTGKYDAYTEIPCNSIDSFLLNFAYNNPAADGTYAIKHWFERMVHQFRYRAERAGFDWNTATMYIVMSQNMWECISRVYACAGLDLCSATGNNRLNLDAGQAGERHREYLSTMELPILGRNYPVVVDNMIPETTGQANGTCSDIYFLTTEINGETVTYGEYQDFNQTYGSVRDEFMGMFGSDDIAITDNGRFAIIRQNERGCFDVQGYTKPRVVAVMPWLLGRIQNVCCNLLGEPFPDVTGSGRVYEKDGGRTSTPIPLLYDDCESC